MEPDYAAELKALQARCASLDGFETAHAYCGFHLDWATTWEDSDPLRAVEQYVLAENHQRTIGSYATGSGEGLASMAEYYAIVEKRADLEEQIADAAVTPAQARPHFEQALALWISIQSAPNAPYPGVSLPAPRIRRLKAKLTACG